MSYKVGSISTLMSEGTNVPSLSSLFSDTSKQLFARSFKPEEFPKMQIEKKNNEELTSDKKVKKKKKTKPVDNDESTTLSVTSTDTIKPVPVSDANAVNKNDCTLFIGNIPVTETIKSITKFFQEYGVIESVRLRSVPVAGTKVDDAGNQNLVKKVCVNAHKFGEQKGSFNAYVVFKSSDQATAALAANNRLLGTRHLRVDKSTPSLFDTHRTVFLGNLPHYADEEELREYFANVSA